MVETKTEEVIETASKKLKSDAMSEQDGKTAESNILNEFKFVKVLSERSSDKRITVQAVKKDQDSAGAAGTDEAAAVIIFEKPHFSLDEVNSILDLNNEFNVDLVNDIYHRMCVYPQRPHNSVHIQLIYPATPAHIAKYSEQQMFLLRETYEDWQTLTSKYLETAKFSIQWVFNILEHKTESERILFEDADPVNGFIILPDMKWDGKTMENMYCLAIVHQKGIRSLRDLNASHLSLLANIQAKSLKAIEDKYGVRSDKVRAYLHYQPSFYHLHVHFNHIKNEAHGMPERNHSLTTVMENLRIASDYYQRATLEMPLRGNEGLFEVYKDRFQTSYA